MTGDDIDAVVTVAAAAFPDHFEARGCFEERLALNPRGCLVLAEPDGPAQGYLIAYPWPVDSAPPLNGRLATLPPSAAVLYLHDLALLPTARGGGHARTGVSRVAALARADGWPTIALVAVNDAVTFWEGQGFVVRDTPALHDKLAGYGPDARYMVRPV